VARAEVLHTSCRRFESYLLDKFPTSLAQLADAFLLNGKGFGFESRAKYALSISGCSSAWQSTGMGYQRSQVQILLFGQCQTKANTLH
jgi:hypothetical protein